MKKYKYLYALPTYFGVAIMVPLTSPAWPCYFALHHVHKMCGDFRLHQMFIHNHVESKGGVHLGVLWMMWAIIVRAFIHQRWEVRKYTNVKIISQMFSQCICS